MEEQINEQPIDEHKYEDLDRAFITPDHSAGYYPDYFSPATSTASSFSTSVGITFATFLKLQMLT